MDGFPNSKPKQLLPPTFCFERVNFISSRFFIQFRESTIKEVNSLPNARIFELVPEQIQPNMIRSFGNPGKYIWMHWDIHTQKIYLLERNPDSIGTFLNELINPLRQKQENIKQKKECTLYVINPQSRLDNVYDEIFQVQLDLTETISSKQIRTQSDFRLKPIFSKYFSMIRIEVS